jgi:sigma-B regulation protein RsbU (phosphoserine phosphatase)
MPRLSQQDSAFLVRISKAWAERPDTELGLSELMDQVNAYLCTEAMSIFVLDDSQNDLVARYAAGAASQEVIGVRLALGQGVVGWVVQYGEDLIVPSTDLDSRFFSGVDEKTGFVTRSILCVPLLQGGRARGAIETFNKATGHFTDDDVTLLQQIADLVAGYVVTQEQR